MKPIIFDIETGPLPIDQLERIMPKFEAPGNIKDTEKIKAAIEQKKADFIENAPLHANTGRILSIGFLVDGMFQHYDNLSGGAYDEEQILKRFFMQFLEFKAQGRKIIGHNIKNFDIPFILRRSMHHCIVNNKKMFLQDNLRYYQLWVIDTMEEWGCGEYRPHISLNELGLFFNVGKKTETGDQFHKWWFSGKTEEALNYLENDLRLCYAVAEKMGLMNDEAI